MIWRRRHILSLADWEEEEYNTLIQTASSFSEVLLRHTKKVPALQGLVVTNMFFEPSTRTRSSFELASKRLSADILNFSPGTSSLAKGETILDTAKTYLAMGANIMVIRHKRAGVPRIIANEMDRLQSGVSILNAGDGMHEHPSQGLLDLFTICSELDSSYPRLELLQDKKIVIVGDILHSRVARSNIWSLTKAGANVHLVGPPTLLPKWFEDIKNTCNKGQLFIHWNLEVALKKADFIMTLRLQKERMTDALLPSLREYHKYYGITHKHLYLCQPNVKILHPGPVNRGIEISSSLIDDPNFSLVQKQITNSIAIRMALLFLLGTFSEQ
ncbi:MAG: aspartate carbamoyltransferase catalytic subunit [Candidatus Atelocyanobacterium thalassa]|uniref:Aspartate carbamoyltransferase n=1 Tax=Candidatus Atelocyanobacterium thalassa isolate SIO64986 TaxID=1527444 RepID=A0A086CGJ6_9CHRO|nr:MAG: aspartate carbamoyltransferase [Candidatus Atelocyanobacterium thalassa isolate SIO64986]